MRGWRCNSSGLLAHPDAQRYRCVAGGILPTGSGPKGIRRDRVKAHAPGNMFLILLDAVHGNLGLIALRLPEAAAR